MVLQKQSKPNTEQSIEHLQYGKKLYYEFERNIRPRKLIKSVFRDNNIISSYHSSRIHKNYYTVGILAELSDHSAEQVQIEIWDDGFSIYVEESCPDEYLELITDEIEKKIPLL